MTHGRGVRLRSVGRPLRSRSARAANNPKRTKIREKFREKNTISPAGRIAVSRAATYSRNECLGRVKRPVSWEAVDR